MIIRELLTAFGLQFDEEGFERANHAIEGLKKKAEALGAIFLESELVRGVVEFTKSQAELGESVEITARRIGITTDALQELHFAAGQNNVDAGELDSALTKLGRKASSASKGTGAAAEGFRRLGVNIRDSNGHLKPTDQLFADVADGLARITDEGEQTDLAFKTMGGAGVALLPVLQEGSKSIEEMRARARELGGVMDEKTVKASAKLGGAIKGLAFQFQGLKNIVWRSVLPAAQAFVEFLQHAIFWLERVTKGTNGIAAGLVALAATAAAVGVVMLAPYLPFLALVLLIGTAIIALTAVFEDFYGFLTGRKSAIGYFLDDLFGIGTAARVANTALSALRETMEAIDQLKRLHASEAEAERTARELAELRRQQAAGFPANDAGPQTMPETNGQYYMGGKSAGDFLYGVTFSPAAFADFVGRVRGVVPPLPLPAINGTPAAIASPNWVSTVTLNVNGAGDPKAVAGEAYNLFRAHDEAQRRNALDALKQRPAAP